MTSIDTRVVEMHFDNAQFESGIANTSKSLVALDEQLTAGSKNTGVFTALSNAIEDLSFTPVGEGISHVTSMAVQLGSTISEHVGGAVQSVLGMMGKVGSMLVDWTKSGGMNRALSLERAKFLIEGLGGDWKTALEDVSYAVSGTAYTSSDAAAAAGSMLASGVELGDNMKHALRGISGVAAMTSSAYSDIATTFTRMAGTGKASNMYLDLLSARGLNVHQTLADYLNSIDEGASHTSDTIREMVSKGEVDFQTFADAMDSAFGEHATEANNTFEGSFDNMKAALSRIGEAFATPWLTHMTDVWNATRQVFEGIKRGLTDTFSDDSFASLWGYTSSSGEEEGEWGGWNLARSWDQNLGHVTDKIAAWFNYLGKKPEDGGVDAFSRLASSIVLVGDSALHSTALVSTFLIDALGEGIEAVADSGKLGDLLTPVAVGIWKVGEAAIRIIPDIGRIFGNIFGIVIKVINVFETIADAVSGTTGSLQQFLGGITLVEDVIHFLADVTDAIVGFVDVIIPSAEDLSFLGETVSAIGAVFAKVMPTLSKILGDFGVSLTKLFSDLGKFVVGGLDLISSLLVPAVEGLGLALAWASPYLEEFAKNFNDYFSSMVIDFGAVGEMFSSFAASIRNFFGEMTEFFVGIESLDDLAAKISDNNAFDKLPTLAKVLLVLGSALAGILALGPKIVAVFSKVGEKLNSWGITAGTVIEVLLKIPKIFEMISKAFGKNDESVEQSGDKLSSFKSKLDEVKTGVTNFVSGVKDKLVNAFAEITPERIMEFASGIVAAFKMITSAVATLRISGISSALKKLSKGVGPDGLKVNVDVVSALDGVLGKLKAGLMSLQSSIQSGTILKIAIAIGILVAACILLANLPADKLAVATAGLAGMMATIGFVMRHMTKTFTTLAKDTSPAQIAKISGLLNSMSGIMLALGAVVLAMSVSFALMALVPKDRLKSGLAGMIVILVVLESLIATILGIVTHSDPSTLGKIEGFTAVILAIGASITLMMLALAVVALVPMDKMTNAIIAMFAVFGALLAFFIILNATTKSTQAMLKVNAATTFLALIPLLYAITGVITVLGAMDTPQLAKGTAAVIAIIAILSVFALLASAAGRAKSFGFVGLASALLALTVSVSAITGLLVLLTQLEVETDQIDKAYHALMSVASVIVVLMAVMALIGAVTDAGDVLRSVALLVVLTGSLLVLSAAMLAFGVLGPVSLIGIAVLALLAGAVALLGAVARVFSKPLIVLSVVFLALGASCLMFGAGLNVAVQSLITLIFVLPSLIKMFSNAMGVLEEEWPKISSGIKRMMSGTADAAAESAPQIGAAFGAIALAGLTSLGEHVSEFVHVGVAFVVSLVRGLIEEIQFVIDAAILIGVSLINGLAESINNNRDMVLTSIGNLIESVGLLILQGLADLIEMVPGGDKLVSFLGLRDFISSAGDELNQSISDVKAQTEARQAELTAALSTEMQQSGEESGEAFGGSAGSSITDFMNQELPGLTEQGLETSDIESLWNTEGMTDAESYGEGFNTGLEDFGVSSATKAFGDSLPDAQSFTSLGTTNGEAFGSGFISNLQGKFAALFPDVISPEINKPEEFSTAGSTDATAFGGSSGFLSFDFSGSNRKAVGDLTTVTGSDSATANNSGYSLGKDFGNGYANGIASGEVSGRVRSAVQGLVSDALAAVKAEQESRSPSKKTAILGGYFGSGYAIGIANSVSMVASSAEMLVDSAMDATEMAASHMWDVLDQINWNASPTISPVVDMSDVYAAQSVLGGMWGAPMYRSAAYAGAYAHREFAPQASSYTAGDNITISLNYEAGADANEMVMGIARAIKMRSSMKG